MRWRGRGRDSDVIDARGAGPARGRALPIGGGAGLIGVLVFLAFQLLSGGGASGFEIPTGFDSGARAPQGGEIPPSQDPERNLRDFSGAVFSDVQDTWTAIFREEGRDYRRAKLYLYRGSTDTGCGFGSAAAGPFYCPADERVYLDLSFYGDMTDKLDAPGDFAWAYVIAHEVGHHVQNLLGTSDEVRRVQASQPGQRNELSVRLELQADCFAGVWAHAAYTEGDLEPGDIEEAMAASQAVGDDRLQRQAGRAVEPDSFTHGTSEQRARWFDAGRRSGRPADCDTFSGDV